MTTWHLYLVRTRDGALYTGIATDVERRLGEHRRGAGSKFLRSRGPLELVFRTPIGDRPSALQAEARLKKLPKAAKERIVHEAPARERLLELLAVEPSRPSRPKS